MQRRAEGRPPTKPVLGWPHVTWAGTRGRAQPCLDLGATLIPVPVLTSDRTSPKHMRLSANCKSTLGDFHPSQEPYSQLPAGIVGTLSASFAAPPALLCTPMARISIESGNADQSPIRLKHAGAVACQRSFCSGRVGSNQLDSPFCFRLGLEPCPLIPASPASRRLEPIYASPSSTPLHTSHTLHSYVLPCRHAPCTRRRVRRADRAWMMRPAKSP